MLTAMGGQDVLQVGLGLPAVAAVAHAVAAGELADGALDAGPDGVALVPGGVLLVSAVISGTSTPRRGRIDMSCSSGVSRDSHVPARLDDHPDNVSQTPGFPTESS
jgi:hypothetical protein